MVVDISALKDYLPILSFLVVFVAVFAVLVKTKIVGENKWIQLFLSFIVATIFVTASSARQFVINVTPWFAVFVLLLFFVLALIGFSGKMEFLEKGIGVVFAIALLLLFLISAYFSFGETTHFVEFKDWLFTPKVWGALVLVIVSAIVSWVLVKSK